MHGLIFVSVNSCHKHGVFNEILLSQFSTMGINDIKLCLKNDDQDMLPHGSWCVYIDVWTGKHIPHDPKNDDQDMLPHGSWCVYIDVWTGKHIPHDPSTIKHLSSWTLKSKISILVVYCTVG
jgi:hypothetical protein